MMADQTRASTPSQGTVTVVESEDEQINQQDVRSVRLKLRKPKARKAVQWESGTIDNEHMNKMKSKCCCIYEKPRAFDESSSSSEEEDCEHCFGHVEKRKKKPGSDPHGSHDHKHDHDHTHEHHHDHDHTHDHHDHDHTHEHHHDHSPGRKDSSHDPIPSISTNG